MVIVCWLWKGWRDIYSAKHVNRLAAQLDQRMRSEYRLICITDDPKGIECETFPLWTMPPARIPRAHTRTFGDPPIPDCYTRLRMFDPRIGRWFGERVLSMDLDCVILDDLTPLFREECDFKAAKGYKSHLCGSMWWLKIGTHADVWDDYHPVETPKLIDGIEVRPGVSLSGSDQAWMSLKIPAAPLWTEDDGVYQFMELKPQRIIPANARIVYFAGSIKPWDRECQMISPALYSR